MKTDSVKNLACPSLDVFSELNRMIECFDQLFLIFVKIASGEQKLHVKRKPRRVSERFTFPQEFIRNVAKCGTIPRSPDMFVVCSCLD